MERSFRRGDVLYMHLDPVEGSEQGGTRPVLVVSSDVLNEALPVLTVAVITSRKTERVFPSEVLVRAPEGGLRKDSKVLVHQLRTVAVSRVERRMGGVRADTLAAVMQALRIVFDMQD